MKNKPTLFTIKIYGEGLTEWFYFDKLRSLERFSFTLEPDLPAKSRSSYKKRLRIIDKELRKSADERADLIILITDLDNIVADESELRAYKEAKSRYKEKGVVFIESLPCIELWFFYHFKTRFDKSCYATYDEIKQPLKQHLPDYDKSRSYYTGNKLFNGTIMSSYPHRISATRCAHHSCRYPAIDGELANFTNIHELIMFLHMLQFFYILSDILHSKVHASFDLIPEVEGLGKINAWMGDSVIYTMKVECDKIMCYLGGPGVEIPLDFDYKEASEDIQLFLTQAQEALLSNLHI